MTESDHEPGGISDDDLPEDLQPGEENPLAEPLDTDEVDPDDLDLGDGKGAEESEESEESGDEDGDGE